MFSTCTICSVITSKDTENENIREVSGSKECFIGATALIKYCM